MSINEEKRPRWIVTGGASGMGLALAREIASEGMDVCVWDIQPPPSGLNLSWTQVDLIKVDSIRTASMAISGEVRVLAHCAGSMFHINSDDSSATELLLKATALHAGALIASSQALKPFMKRGSAIVAVTSIAQDVIYPRTIAYGPSKAALARVVSQLAVDLGSEGIRVNGVAPGAIRTPMSEAIWTDPEKARHRLESIPLGRAGTPEDIVNAIRFLASDKASYITGCIVTVDGGLRLGLAGRLGA
jgi:NAD(P)-dependent dehydrogenase (short-subunit alcohol dehydrogenase family)